MNDDRTGWPTAQDSSLPEPPPDLPTQLEGLLHQVWIEEDDWRREERIDRVIRLVRDA
jgi:hypothetical protein